MYTPVVAKRRRGRGRGAGLSCSQKQQQQLEHGQEAVIFCVSAVDIVRLELLVHLQDQEVRQRRPDSGRGCAAGCG